MKKQFLMFMALGAMAFTSCQDTGTTTETNENDSSTPDRATGTDSGATTYNYDAEYRDRAARMSRQVSQDLQLDTAAEARIQNVYYNRARQIDELEQRYSSTNRSGGLATDSGAMMAAGERADRGEMDVNGTIKYPATYYNEMKTIDNSADTEMKGFLNAQQYQLYQANRQKYYDMDMKYKMENGTKLKVEGDEYKLKTDDAKIKRDGEEMKYKSGDTKIKKEGDETKIKTKDSKLKQEGDELKYKSGDTKIKIEN